MPPSLRAVLSIGSLSACIALASGCCSAGNADIAAAQKEPLEMGTSSAAISQAPSAESSIRVGGDLAAAVSGSDGDYRAGACRIDTPLPVGYPAPTPPGAIDLKTYPLVRLAEVTSTGDPDNGMNSSFWPLFNHIKKHDIAMTSPVEMNYRGVQTSDRPTPQTWSMAFLYRNPELNTPGVEGRVTVRDSAPVTVVAVGLKGNYSMSLVQRGMRQIEEWLASNPQWEQAGDWRALYYNGPTLFWWNKWAEVQVPVRRSADAPPAAVSSSHSARQP